MHHRSKTGLSIADARRRNRRRIVLMWFKVAVFFVVVSVAAAYGWEFVVKPQIVEQNLSNFPISVAGDAAVKLEKFEKGFCILNKHGLSFYEKDGSELKSREHSFENPTTHCCGKYVLSYDRGGKFCSVSNSETEFCSLVFDSDILLAKVAENGNFAVLTKSDGCFCVLNVYNLKGQQIFKWSSVENLLVDFDFTKEGSGCFASVVGVDSDGFEKTILYNFKFNQAKEVSKKVLNGVMPVAVKVVGSRVVAACVDQLLVLDGNCGIIKSVQFPCEWNSFCLSSGGYFAFAFGQSLIIYDKLANVFSKYDLNGYVKRIKIEGGKVFVLADNKFYVFNLHLKVLKCVELNKVADDFFCDRKYGYFLFGNIIEKFKIF